MQSVIRTKATSNQCSEGNTICNGFVLLLANLNPPIAANIQKTVSPNIPTMRLVGSGKYANTIKAVPRRGGKIVVQTTIFILLPSMAKPKDTNCLPI